MKIRKIEIDGGALFFLALLHFLDRDGIVVWILLACTIHEIGHWWMICFLGGKIDRIRLTCGGAELRLASVVPLAPWKMLLSALAGPLLNLILALSSEILAQQGKGERLYLFAGINLGLAIFNLLPAIPLDGGRVLSALLAWCGCEEIGMFLTKLCSGILSGILILSGLYLLWQSDGRNFTLLITGIWMMVITWYSSMEKGNAL